MSDPHGAVAAFCGHTPDHPPAAPLALRLFGPFQAWVHGEPLPHLRSRKGQWLLALLALRPGCEVERDWLMALLWPESPEKQAAHSLRTSLTDLRRALGPEAARLRSPTPRTLALDLHGAAVDLLTFDQAIRQGSGAVLEEAVALYRGPLLEGCAEEWVLPERQQREQAFLEALETLAAQAQEADDRAGAERHLRRVVATDPLRESAQRALMRTLAAGGNYAAALLIYRELRLRLHRELNTEPGSETRQLFAAIRDQSQGKAAAPSSVGLSLPPPVSHNLPHSLTRFIGREPEIAAVAELLSGSPDQGGARLVTLTGAGGCGKSRLALEVARRQVDSIPDGVWLVELAALADPALVPQVAAGALNVREEPGEAVESTLVQALRSRRLLVLLDNCEHLIETCARLAKTLLEACPHLRILATSREALGLPGERLYRVPPLSLPPAVVESRAAAPASVPAFSASLETSVVVGSDGPVGDPLTPLTASEAVQLFLDRAAGVLPTFRLTTENAASVASVCRRLDGIPLAIELAAARLRLLPVEEIANRLDDRFRLLTRGSRTALRRHQTLRAAMDWSYDLLPLARQTLLRRLSIFAGGFAVTAAEAVCADGAGLDPRPAIRNEEILDLLQELVDRSLVVVVEHEGEVRNRLLETVRAYGWERLTPEERSVLGRRHADYYLAFAEAADARLRGPEQYTWFGRLTAEIDNLRAALTWYGQTEGNAAESLRLATALAHFWEVRSGGTEGRRWLDQALARGTACPAALRAQAAYAAGLLAYHQADYTEAAHRLKQSVELFRQQNDRWGLSNALSLIGSSQTLCDLGGFGEATALKEETRALCREIGNDAGLAFTLLKLGNDAWAAGDNAGAEALLEESLMLYRKGGDRRGIAMALGELAYLSIWQARYERSEALAEEKLALHQPVDDRPGIAQALWLLGQVARCRGEYDRAESLLKESLALRRETGEQGGIADTLSALGNLAIGQKDTHRARSYLDESLAINRELERHTDIIWQLDRLAVVAVTQGDDERARIHYHEGLTLAREVGDLRGLVSALHGLASLTCRQGDYLTARALLVESLTIGRELDERKGIAACLEGLAIVATGLGHQTRAVRLFAAASALREAIDAPLSPAERGEVEPRIAALRTALDQETFALSWALGRAASLEAAIADACEDSSPSTGARHRCCAGRHLQHSGQDGVT